MPYRRLPNTVTAVIRQLTTVGEAWGKYPQARLTEAAQFDKIDDGPYTPGLLSRLIKEAGDVPLALAAQLCNTVECRLENDDAYAHLNATGRRAIARRWGVVYIYGVGETPDPGDDNAANTMLPGPATPPQS